MWDWERGPGEDGGKELVFTNAKIFQSGVEPGTNAGLQSEPVFAQSIVIHGENIVFAGDEKHEAVQAARANGAAVHDLGGKTVLPGFIDGHIHLMLLGTALNKLDLGHCKTLAEIQSTIKSYAAANPSLSRILCRNWMHSMTPDGVSAADLAGLDAQNRAILIDTKDLHFTWCNSVALEELKADTFVDVLGGIIERDADGKPTGVFGEAANITYIWPYLPMVSSLDERIAAIRSAVEEYHRAGYTGLIDMAMDQGAWEALQAFRKKYPVVPMRIAAYWLIKPSETEAENLAQVDRAIELAGQFNHDTTPDCRIVGIKVICDGIIDACTAGLTEPYSHTGDTTLPLWTHEQLLPVVDRATEGGLQVALHAIGDATIATAVDVLSTPRIQERIRRPRIEHIELASARDAQRLGAARITASIQPVHSDPAILRAWPKLLGPHRCGRAFCYREFSDAGAPLALGSDAPTAPHGPLGNVYVAATRRSTREPGMSIEEQGLVVRLEQALGVCEAVAAGTQGTAYSVYDEGRVGALAAGKKADFVVVDMEWEKEKLMEAKVVQTWWGGVKAWAEGE